MKQPKERVIWTTKIGKGVEATRPQIEYWSRGGYTIFDGELATIKDKLEALRSQGKDLFIHKTRKGRQILVTPKQRRHLQRGDKSTQADIARVKRAAARARASLNRIEEAINRLSTHDYARPPHRDFIFTLVVDVEINCCSGDEFIYSVPFHDNEFIKKVEVGPDPEEYQAVIQRIETELDIIEDIDGGITLNSQYLEEKAAEFGALPQGKNYKLDDALERFTNDKRAFEDEVFTWSAAFTERRQYLEGVSDEFNEYRLAAEGELEDKFADFKAEKTAEAAARASSTAGCDVCPEGPEISVTLEDYSPA